MIEPINKATPEQIAAFHAGRLAANGGGSRKSKKPTRWVKPWVREFGGMHVAQMAVLVPKVQSCLPPAHVAHRILRAKNGDKTRRVKKVISALQLCMRHIDRDAITHIVWMRINEQDMDDDNIVYAFKDVRDATCCWIVRGDDVSKRDLDRIGDFDKMVTKERGVTWECKQMHGARREKGIQIRFRLGS